MKVLSIGSDKKLFEENSAVLMRQVEYAKQMEESHIIVFSLKSDNFQKKSIGNLHLYPTNSSSRVHYIFDATSQGKEIIKSKGLQKGNAVITTQDPFESGLVGHRLQKASNIPLQLQIHTDFLDPHFKNSHLNRIRVWIAKKIIPKARGIRVVSSVISDSIKKTFPNLKAKIDILPIFVDVERIFRFEKQFYMPEKIPSSIFVVSRLTQEKRIDVALEAFKQVTIKHNYVQMIIVGNGPEKNNLERKIEELNLSKNIKIEEWKHDVPENLYKRAEIFLLTSEFEGYGMTLIEAGAVGCPIVTTRVGVAKTELFKNGENSFVCPVGDVDCLAESIIELISDPSKRQLFSERMQDSIRKTAMTQEQYVEKYVMLLESLI